MYFIGSGSLLTHAVMRTLKLGGAIHGVCCQFGDSALPKLNKLAVPIFESDNPSVDLMRLLELRPGEIVFSINNKFILNDNLLSLSSNIFNVHNGLVQGYRGIGEICVFAALCSGEFEYGATLHKILPNHNVDSGPVVAQVNFYVDPSFGFCDLMRMSLNACMQIFEENIHDILNKNYYCEYVAMRGSAFSYRDIGRLCLATDSARLARACDFGVYKSFFPKLVSAVEF